MREAPPLPRLVVAVAVGAALGALARWVLGEAFPGDDGFPWTTFAINVIGSFGLALLPAASGVLRRPTLAVALGPGVLGGFTTLSAYSEQSRSLLADGRLTLAATYLFGTLATCLLAVAIADRWSAPEARAEFADEGGDE